MSQVNQDVRPSAGVTSQEIQSHPSGGAGHRLAPLFNFSSLAVIGASESGSHAASSYRALQQLGFQGQFYPVNPRRAEINGMKAYPSVGDIPGPVDAALVVIPQRFVVRAVEECADRGTRAVIIISAGFAEAGAEGREVQNQLTSLIRQRDLLVVGPNCLGMISVANHCGAWSGMLPEGLHAGSIGVVSNSGGLLNEVTSYGTSRGLGFSHMVSSGNEAGLTSADMIDFYVSDPATSVILAILETVRDPDLFVKAAERAAAARKPLVVLKMGASQKGLQAAQTHTGALAGSDDVYSAFFRQRGIIRVNDIDELIDMGVLLSHAVDVLRVHPTERVGIIEISGGGKGLFCDTSARAGVDLPDLAPETLDRLKDLPDYIDLTNPMDTGGSWNQPDKATVYPQVLDAFASQPDMDVIVSRYTIPRQGPLNALNDRLSEMQAARTQHPDRLFVVLSRTADQFTDEWRQAIQQQDVAFLPGYGRGMQALGKLGDYSRFIWRNEAPVEPPSPLAAGHPGQGQVLNEIEAKQLVSAAGIPVVATTWARSAEEAVAMGSAAGFPVAAKVISPQIVHKSDVGGVRLNLQDARAVEDAFASLKALAEARGARFQGVAIQPMATPGVEVVLGAHRDPQFGPVILFGLGGIAVEVTRDVALRVAPIDESEAASMLTQIRAHALLEGARGQRPVDRAALASALARLSNLMLVRPDITSLDLNPVFAYSDGAIAVDARVELQAP